MVTLKISGGKTDFIVKKGNYSDRDIIEFLNSEFLVEIKSGITTIGEFKGFGLKVQKELRKQDLSYEQLKNIYDLPCEAPINKKLKSIF